MMIDPRICEKCGSDSRVNEARSHKAGAHFRRRRVCLNRQCGHRWTTLEQRIDEIKPGPKPNPEDPTLEEWLCAIAIALTFHR